MIERILPESVVSAESRARREQVDLFPEEAEYISRSVPHRQDEFHAVRSCARRALAALGLPPSRWSPAPAANPAGPHRWWAA